MAWGKQLGDNLLISLLPKKGYFLMANKTASVIIFEGVEENEYIEETEIKPLYPLKKLRRIENSLNITLDDLDDDLENNLTCRNRHL